MIDGRHLLHPPQRPTGVSRIAARHCRIHPQHRPKHDPHWRHCSRHIREGQRGIALLEWLWAISIALTLMVATIPLAQGAWQSIQSATVAQSLVRTLRLAQQEAQSRSARVTLAPSDCELASNGPWSCPWIIFIDRSGDRAFDADTEPWIRTVAPPFSLPIVGTGEAVVFGPLGTTSMVQSFVINQRHRVSLSWARISMRVAP